MSYLASDPRFFYWKKIFLSVHTGPLSEFSTVQLLALPKNKNCLWELSILLLTRCYKESTFKVIFLQQLWWFILLQKSFQIYCMVIYLLSRCFNLYLFLLQFKIANSYIRKQCSPRRPSTGVTKMSGISWFSSRPKMSELSATSTTWGNGIRAPWSP